MEENLDEAASKCRTRGDGMDSISTSPLKEASRNVITLKYRSADNILKSLKPVEPKTPIIKLIPKYIPKERKTSNLIFKKMKEPKFVPYEPYKGAVEPIIPHKKIIRPIRSNRNNVDIQDLVTQMSDIRMAELNKAKIEAIKSDEPVITRKLWEEEKRAYETDIKNLRETNAHLENQLKFQAQVNGELKTLLVAAVGEDLETRVQHLTEDKLQLARALLNSANHLTSHQEQTEWLSGQCEVWRSKFLASSLMVEELARWKSALGGKINDLQQVVKHLLEEREKVHSTSLEIFVKLNAINNYLKKYESDVVPLKTSNLIEVTGINYNLLEDVIKELIPGKIPPTNLELLNGLPRHTPSELDAIQVLKNPVLLKDNPDAVCKAVMGAAMSLGGGQMYLQHPSLHATCCAHCQGEVQDI